jgi:hypothetical protein
MEGREAWQSWLSAVARIHDNLVLLGPAQARLSVTLRNLLRRVEETGVFAEERIHEEAARDAGALLNNFVLVHHKVTVIGIYCHNFKFLSVDNVLL